MVTHKISHEPRHGVKHNFFRWFAVVFGWEVLTRGFILLPMVDLWTLKVYLVNWELSSLVKKRRAARICNKHDKCIGSLLDRLNYYVICFKLSNVYSSKWLLNYTHTNLFIKNATSFTLKPLCYCKYIIYPPLLLYFLIEKRASHASLILKKSLSSATVLIVLGTLCIVAHEHPAIINVYNYRPFSVAGSPNQNLDLGDR